MNDESSKQILSEIAQKLDLLISLLSVSIIDGKKQRDQISILANAGLGPSKIAEMVGTTRNTVNVALSGLRKSGAVRRVQTR